MVSGIPDMRPEGIVAQVGVNVYPDTGPTPKLAIVAVGEPSYS